MKIQAYKEPNSGKWFWLFDFNFSTYRANQGYDTKGEAEYAAGERLLELLPKKELQDYLSQL
jgi:hypothetical protein